MQVVWVRVADRRPRSDKLEDLRAECGTPQWMKGRTYSDVDRYGGNGAR